MSETENFESYNLEDELKKSLERLKFIRPTPIQSKVMNDALSCADIMARAETGSGKTLAYSLPMLNQLLLDPSKISLVLAPTRELVQQIAGVIRDVTASIEGFCITSLVGGSDMGKQVRALKRKPRVVVATPGRLNDHLRRRNLKLKNLQCLVIDEGDRMLDMGFAPQLEEIFPHLPEIKQTMLFSATLPKKVKELAAVFLNQPKIIEIGGESLPVASIKQSIVEVLPKEKLDRTVDELNARSGSIMVFVRTKTRVDDVTRTLKSYGFKVEAIHGDKTQGQRNRVIKKFKEGTSRILVATDIAARGLDVPQVEHVINYDLPRMKEDYVHRVGRTARNGADGEALSYITPSDHKAWLSLIKTYQIKGCELTAKVEFVKPKKKYGKKKSSDRKSSGKKKYGKKKSSDRKSSDRKSSDKKSGFKSRSQKGDERSSSNSKKSNSKKSNSKKSNSKKRNSKKSNCKKSNSKKTSNFSRKKATFHNTHLR